METSLPHAPVSFAGRVAVTHVQGPPKGGGALCVRRVSNTRLGPPLTILGRCRWSEKQSYIPSAHGLRLYRPLS
jgi:hypothetical protein